MSHVRIYNRGKATCGDSEYSIDLHVPLVQISLYCWKANWHYKYLTVLRHGAFPCMWYGTAVNMAETESSKRW